MEYGRTPFPKASLDQNPAVAAGHFVLQREIEGLHALSQALDEKFIATVDLLSKIKGHVIISGMGKSGHVARKIAATLASTGTPAFFVHPGEASHGDLGMITKNDAIMLLSNSGETAELRDIIGYAQRFDIPLIGIVRRKTSALVTAANIAMVLPEIPEVLPVGAPTTSTTMMIALGDAIAVALWERKGLSDEDFGVFHPGGKLGKAFTKVEELMHTGDQLPIVHKDMLMKEVIIEMTQKSLGCAGVVNNEGELCGIVTDGDLRRHMGSNLMEKKSSEVMTKSPVTITSNSLVAKALAVMEERAITSLFVIDEATNYPVGILHIHDILRSGVA